MKKKNKKKNRGKIKRRQQMKLKKAIPKENMIIKFESLRANFMVIFFF